MSQEKQSIDFKKIKKFYHATLKSNLSDILFEGIRPSNDGLIYLTETAQDSAKFLLVRNCKIEDIVSIEIDAKYLDFDCLSISSDHSVVFFGCEAYCYSKNIPSDILSSIYDFK